MRKLLIVALAIAILLVVGGSAWFALQKPAMPAATPTPSAKGVAYINSQYGFKIALPDDWKGYSVIIGTWKGDCLSQPNCGNNEIQGPMISIRNPQWTHQKPYQDIPIMVFDLSQWDYLQRDLIHIGAAPINPSELAFNANYVFALPARYNYAFPAGWQEVDQIIQDKSVQSLAPVDFSKLPAESQILLCAGLPNNSTQHITQTTRLFINLPKSIYQDKDHNLQFSAVSGNAAANWISNAGSYGQAFQASDNCWSYYYEFDGTGALDLTAKSTVSGQPDYSVTCIISK